MKEVAVENALRRRTMLMVRSLRKIQAVTPVQEPSMAIQWLKHMPMPHPAIQIGQL